MAAARHENIVATASSGVAAMARHIVAAVHSRDGVNGGSGISGVAKRGWHQAAASTAYQRKWHRKRAAAAAKTSVATQWQRQHQAGSSSINGYRIAQYHGEIMTRRRKHMAAS